MTPGRCKSLAALAVVALLGTACTSDGEATSSNAPAAETKPLILATTTIWADIVANVACDGAATTEALIPAGADSHSFEPSLADRGRLDEAALVVANGLGLEERLAPTLDAARGDGVPLFVVADHVDAAPDEHAEVPAGDDGHDHGAVDPHLWFDPLLVASVLDGLAATLVEDAGLEPAAVEQCLADYQQRLTETHRAVEATLAEVPAERRVLVTNHAAFGRFAERYGLEVVGTVIPSTSSMAETNPGALEELAEVIEAAGVEAIFVEESTSAPDAEALARRAGDVEVVPLFTEFLGGPGSGAETYLDLLTSTAERIADGLAEG